MATIKKQDSEVLDPTYTEDDFNELPPSDIIAYNELRSCADLYRMYSEGILDISPDFQRSEIFALSGHKHDEHRYDNTISFLQYSHCRQFCD